MESSKHEFAFDNPYFKDDDTIDGIKKDNYQTQKDTIILLEGTNYLILSIKLTLRFIHIIIRNENIYLN